MDTEGDLPPLIQERARYYAQSHGTPTESQTQALLQDVRQLHSTVAGKGGDVPPLPARHLMYAELLALEEYLRGVEASGLRPAGALTPEEVRDVQFRSVRFKPAYDMEDVDDFLDVVEERVRAGQPPMPPQDAEFKTNRLRQGYDIDEVDRFVSRIRHASAW